MFCEYHFWALSPSLNLKSKIGSILDSRSNIEYGPSCLIHCALRFVYFFTLIESSLRLFYYDFKDGIFKAVFFHNTRLRRGMLLLFYNYFVLKAIGIVYASKIFSGCLKKCMHCLLRTSLQYEKNSTLK